MDKHHPLLLAGVAVALASGCGRVSDLIDDQVMEATLEIVDDSADDGVVESSSPLTQAFGLNGGDGGALTVGCVDVVTDPDPLPSPRPDAFSVTWTFNDCSWRGRTQSGTRTVAHTRNADGSRDLVGSRSLERVRLNGDHVTIDTTGSMHALGVRADGEVSRTLSFDERRVRTKADGSAGFDLSVTGRDLSVVTTFSAERELERVFNGEIVIKSNRRDFDMTSTFTDVTRAPAQCCHPRAGTIHQVVRKDGEIERERTFTFGAECGVVERDDGERVELAPCG